ncbi:MAG: hypothetical protein LBP53_05945 [Candidatus Peribacteria bacterium]|nr:hypothetical protein [Candidatus Peribacteria bacterium]
MVNSGEECDNGELNGKDGSCSTTCKQEESPCERCIVEQNCNSCPCQYADFASDIRGDDKIRAKFRDKTRSIWYRFSPEILVNNFIPL